MNIPNLPALTPQEIADTMRAIAKDPANKIILAHALTLIHMAKLVEQCAEVTA
jgi:hypothetical protein